MARLDGKKRAVYTIVKYHEILKAFAEVERVSTVASMVGFSRNTVSKVVKEFVKLGLLEKSGSGVYLTPLGKAILKDVEELYEVINEVEEESSPPPNPPAEVRK